MFGKLLTIVMLAGVLAFAPMASAQKAPAPEPGMPGCVLLEDVTLPVVLGAVQRGYEPFLMQELKGTAAQAFAARINKMYNQPDAPADLVHVWAVKGAPTVYVIVSFKGCVTGHGAIPVEQLGYLMGPVV